MMSAELPEICEPDIHTVDAEDLAPTLSRGETPDADVVLPLAPSSSLL